MFVQEQVCLESASSLLHTGEGGGGSRFWLQSKQSKAPWRPSSGLSFPFRPTCSRGVRATPEGLVPYKSSFFLQQFCQRASSGAHLWAYVLHHTLRCPLEEAQGLWGLKTLGLLHKLGCPQTVDGLVHLYWS